MFENLEPPRYLEAYPRFDMVRAKAATENEDLEVCEFADQIGRVHGLARFGDMTEDSIVLEYKITLPYLPGVYSSTKLKLVKAPNGVDENRIITCCPKCHKRKVLLVYLHGWACSNCHGLIYRSQTMPTCTRFFEKKNALHSIIKRGRPKGMHHATFSALHKKLSELSKQLKGETVQYLNEHQIHIIQSTWKRKVSAHSLFFSGEMGSDNY